MPKPRTGLFRRSRPVNGSGSIERPRPGKAAFMEFDVSPTRTSSGCFITFEGSEGVGKTTQIQLLRDHLLGRGYDVVVTREPGGTVLGEKLRELIKYFSAPEGIAPEAELLMFGASRAQHVRRIIEPHLQRGGIVLCDRFADSTTVYQGMARGLDPDFIEAMHRFTIGNCRPDITLLLDLDVPTGHQRIGKRPRRQDDRFENESRRFHESVRQGFLALAAREPERVVVIDAGNSPDAVHARILEVLTRVID